MPQFAHGLQAASDEIRCRASGQVRYVLKDYLDAECNANVANTIHPAACEGAAVRLARTHNREEQMIEWIFANQPQLTPDLVKQGARDVGW